METKDSPIGRIPANWPIRTLKELTTKIGSGATPRGGQAAYLPHRINFALVRSQCVHDRYFDQTSLSFISDEQSKALKGAQVREGDVFLNITGDGVTFSRSAMVPKEALPAAVNQHVAIVRADPSQLHPSFLASYLTHPLIKPYIEGFNAGGSRRAITKGHIESFEVPVPPIETQRSIGDFLQSFDDKIELNRRMNATLEEMARALFRDWFVDFGPTRRQMEGATDPAAIMGHAFPPEKATTLAPLFPAKLGDDGLPEGWETCPLKTIVEQQKQSVKPDQHLDETFEHFSLPAFDKASWPTIERGAEIKSNKTAVPANSLLVSKLNPRIERVWVPQLAGADRQICSTEFLCFKPAAGHGRATIEALFRSDQMREKMAAMVTGTSNSHQRVPPKVLMQADVLLPETCGAAFEKVALPFLEKRQANEQENQTLAEMRDLLLPKLMSGEIRLKDAEAAV